MIDLLGDTIAPPKRTNDKPESAALVEVQAAKDGDPQACNWLARFTVKGLILDEAEKLADTLITRDREADDRRLCPECLHLHRAGGWRCGNWLRAGVAMRAKDAQLPGDLVMRLQRCDGFKDMTQ